VTESIEPGQRAGTAHVQVCARNTLVTGHALKAALIVVALSGHIPEGISGGLQLQEAELNTYLGKFTVQAVWDAMTVVLPSGHTSCANTFENRRRRKANMKLK